MREESKIGLFVEILIACKLLRIIYRMLAEKKPFDSNYDEKLKRRASFKETRIISIEKTGLKGRKEKLERQEVKGKEILKLPYCMIMQLSYSVWGRGE